jgi:hypothetical protein
MIELAVTLGWPLADVLALGDTELATVVSVLEARANGN